MSALSYAEQNQYDLLSKFESTQEFNNHFEQAMISFKDHFTKSEYVALNKLRKFAANFSGVAWCKLQKAVAATHADELFGVSRSTFNRMLRKAKSINLVTVIHQQRANHWQKHNVFVFNRLEELIAPVVEKVEIVSKSHTIEAPKTEKIDIPITINLSKLTIKKDNNTYAQAQETSISKVGKVIDFSKQKTNYQKMKELLNNFFNDQSLTYRIYGAWLGQTNKMINKPPFEIAIEAVKAMIFEVKRRNSANLKPLNNPVGYYCGTLTNMIDEHIEEQLRMMQYELGVFEDE